MLTSAILRQTHNRGISINERHHVKSRLSIGSNVAFLCAELQPRPISVSCLQSRGSVSWTLAQANVDGRPSGAQRARGAIPQPSVPFRRWFWRPQLRTFAWDLSVSVNAASTFYMIHLFFWLCYSSVEDYYYYASTWNRYCSNCITIGSCFCSR